MMAVIFWRRVGGRGGRGFWACSGCGGAWVQRRGGDGDL